MDFFKQAKKEGKTSTNPLKESFGNKYNFKYLDKIFLGWLANGFEDQPKPGKKKAAPQISGLDIIEKMKRERST